MIEREAGSGREKEIEEWMSGAERKRRRVSKRKMQKSAIEIKKKAGKKEENIRECEIRGKG